MSIAVSLYPDRDTTNCPFVLQVPKYYKVIKEPIDLSKIKKRLQPANFSHYETDKEFLRDVVQMFTNCFQFNDVSKRNFVIFVYFKQKSPI